MPTSPRPRSIAPTLLALGASLSCAPDDPARAARPQEAVLFTDPILDTLGPRSGLTDATFTLRGVAGRCAQVDAATSRVTLARCDGSAPQRVRVVEQARDRLVELRVGDRCLQPLYGFVIDGVAIEAAACTGGPSQRWALDGDTVRVASDLDYGLAVGNRSGALGSPVTLSARRFEESDRWELTPEPGVTARPTSGFVRVATADALVAALQNARPGAVIEVDPAVTLDLSTRCRLTLTTRVTLRSGRRGAARGALLRYVPSLTTPEYVACRQPDADGAPTAPAQLFVMLGDRSRITGLAIEGPSRNVSTSYPYAIGVGMNLDVNPDGSPRHVEVDHNELFGWQEGAVNAWAPNLTAPRSVCRAAPAAWRPYAAYVTRNYVHANRRNGTGYGVSVGGDAALYALGNTFQGNRHAIAGSGDAGQRYWASLNLVLYSAPSQSEGHPYQDFDMHGTSDNCGSHRGGTAGEEVRIDNNTFFGDDRNNFSLRGRPCYQAVFERNVTRQAADSYVRPWMRAVRVDNCDEPTVLFERNNRYEIGDPARRLGVADFDGDGRDDLLLATGAAWFVSYGGETPWEFRSAATDALADVRFGDFDGDGRADALRATASGLQARWGAEGDWSLLRAGAVPLADLLVGDFDGDRRSDLLWLDGSFWWFSAGGTGLWTVRSVNSQRARDLAVGDFNADGRDDVMGTFSGQWAYRPNGNLAPVTLRASLASSMSGIALADLDADGRPDAVRRRVTWSTLGLPQETMEASYGCTGGWTTLSSTTPDLSLREPALGRFDATPGADLLHWNSDRKLDLARSGVAPRVAHGTEERF